MNSKRINLHILLLGIMAAILVALPGCSDENEVQKSIAEKMVGRWNFIDGYTKLNGEWVSTGDEDQEGWYEFGANGILSGYRRIGQIEGTMKVNWSVEETTGTLTITREEQHSSAKVIFEDEDRLVIYYTDASDSTTGEELTGEFKEVYQRDKKKQ